MYKEFQDFNSQLDVELRRTTAYHPQSNGLVEALNKIIKKYESYFIYLTPLLLVAPYLFN